MSDQASQDTAEQTVECVKCHKQKKASEGVYIWGGSTYCCKDCCDPAQTAQAAENACEFC